MNEEPKNIWKKSWSGPRVFLIWLILVAATMLIFSAGILIIGGPFTNPPDFIELLIFGVVAATILLCLWRFLRWLCSWRNFKRLFFGLACFATLISLFYAEENWRGKHDLKKFEREWEAKGEHFDYASIVPPSVPDDQNFAFSPVWIAEIKRNFLQRPDRVKSWYGDRIYSEEVSNILSLLPIEIMRSNNVVDLPKGYWAKSSVTDLKPWQNYYRNPSEKDSANEFSIAPQPQSPAQDVLFALSRFDPVIEQLRKDSVLPDSRFPVQYSDDDPAEILLPHLAILKKYVQVLQLRAIAELQNDESEKALDDVKLSLRLVDSIRTEPFLISHLVRIASLQITLQPVYEGLEAHQWSDAQLVALDVAFSQRDFLSDYESAMRGERGLEDGVLKFILNSHKNRLQLISDIFNMSGDANSPINNWQFFPLALGPKGWFYQNELRICRFYSLWYLPVVNAQDKIVSPATLRNADAAFDAEFKHHSPENILETMLLPALSNAVKKFAYAQSATDMARVAVALERYRLAHGEYPKTLDALAPHFIEKLPHDIIGGQPLNYRRADDGQFVLYSVGWNETDDGGTAAFKKGSPPTVNIDEGDWVWRYPEK
jgi:hypothetical protein